MVKRMFFFTLWGNQSLELFCLAKLSLFTHETVIPHSPSSPAPGNHHSTCCLYELDYCQFSSVQFSSVAQSCPTLCYPMNRSTPGLPCPSPTPEFTQTHVHRVSDAIQPSYPLSSPSPLPSIKTMRGRYFRV